MLPGRSRHSQQAALQHAVFLRRWKTTWLAALQSADGRVPCIIEDISASGAKLDLDRAPTEGTAVSLVIADAGAIAARIAWRTGEQVGLQFLEKQPWVLDLVAKAVETAPNESASADV
ncbi:MAG TPA: PilZ domain-containing protein [Stellaceae bacterium]|nr:PilZ domain-containing protein [Stellaceae bacterium]